MRLAALLAFVLGVCVLQLQTSLPDVAIIAVLAGGGAVVLCMVRSRGALARTAVLIAVASVGFAYAAAQATWRMADELGFNDEGRDVAVIGAVAGLPVRLERGVRFEFDVDRVVTSDVHVPSRLLLGWYNGDAALQPGEQWAFTVRLKRPHGTMNPGGFDFEAWMLERNLRAAGYVRAGRNEPAPVRVQTMVWAPRYAIERARSNLRDQLLPKLSGKRYGGVLLALVLGDQRAISDADWTLFNRTGIGHLVSISGLHITMIASLAGLAVAALWRRSPALLARAAAQTAAVLAGLMAAFLYALLAGWGVPAQRTVVMLATVGVAWLFSSRIGAATSLALAAALVCLIDPWAVLAPGFWLSFGAVAAIVWVIQGRTLQGGSSAWRAVLHAAVRVQIAVTLALIPATVLLFHQLSIVSPLANAVAIPAVSWAVTPLALLGAMLAVLPAPLSLLAEPVLGMADAIFAIVAALLQWASSFAWANVPVATPPLALVVLAVIGVIWLLAPPGWPLRVIGAIALIPMFVWPATRAAGNEVWVTALDVGQGSALLVEAQDQVWLYDAGPRYSADTDAGERLILPYLRHRGIGRLDGLIVSHLDSDHSGGAASILRGITVGRVISSIASGHPVLGARADVERCGVGMQWTAGPLTFAMVHPAAPDYEAKRPTNSMSCVLLITSGTTRLLLTGDVPLADELALLTRLPTLRADWLSVPHHGSRSSSGAKLLDTVAAKAAVAQAGYRNRFRHPDPDVVARYQARNIRFFRTDHAGALQWRFAADGSSTVSSWRQLNARYWHNRPALASRAAAADPGASEVGVNVPDAIPGPPEPYVGR
ncbi:MAG TPA: DNA internalization-related competence protein ComEC/Rec2 [Burkholderiaceae bacterium]|nr:DNA internalization-related competence protein ComEC/Rec2 [Burkholderiaceae bacterium]